MRIASLSPAVTEILFAIGAGERIVCTDQFSDEPDDAKKLPHLSDHQKIDIDALASYTPEIIFTSTLVQTRLAEELKKHQKWAVIHQDPRSLGDIYSDIRAIGIVVGREKEANALVTAMQNGFSAVHKKAKLLPRKPKVYIEEWHNPPMVSGNWVPEIISVAGGIPLQAQSAKRIAGSDGRNPPSRAVTLEEVQKFDPDLIVLSICGAGKFSDKKLLTTRACWSELRAVREHHVFVIDDSLLNRPGPRLVMGCQRLYGWMFEVLH